MSAEQVARDHYARRRRLSESLTGLARELWSRLAPDDLDGSWARLLPQLTVGVAGAQLAAARRADSYTDEVLEEQDVDPDPIGRVVPDALAGIASDGRPLDSLLLNPVTVVKVGLAAGAPMPQALAAGYANLDMLVRTQLADAGRAADQVAIAARPAVTGYVRMLVGRSCSRCVVLAGRRYGWNQGFPRHPSCDCIHVPAADYSADEIRTDPRRYFDSLSPAAQDEAFTKAGAEAIRAGADIGQVVNARRGMQTATVYGREVQVTTEGTTLRGSFGRARREGPLVRRAGQRVRSTAQVRLMPEQILLEADGDRDEAIRLLRVHGYLTGAAPRQTPVSAPTTTRIPVAQPEPVPTPTPEPAVVVPDVPAAVKGTDRLADEVALANADAAEVERLSAAMKQARHDVMLEQLGARQGFDGLPRQATREDVDAAVSSGWMEIWRGVVGKGTQTAEQINGRLRTGTYEPGRGIYGNGWYFSERRNTAETFRGRDPKTNYPAGGGPDFEPSDFDGPTPTDSLIRVALDPGARVVDYDELKRMAWEWEAAQPRNTPAGRVLSDPGRFAAALGYDAIRVGGQHGDGGMYPGWEDDDPDESAVQYVVLNRTVMLIQRVEDVP